MKVGQSAVGRDPRVSESPDSEKRFWPQPPSGPMRREPGSPEAVAQGCACSTTLNRHGKGTLHGQPRFYYDRNCPVHRIEVAKRAKESG